MYSFEVSIGLLPLFSIVMKKNKPCSESLEQVHLDGVQKWNKMYSFEVCIGLLPLFLIVRKKNKLCSESLEQIHLDGVKKQNKNMWFLISLLCTVYYLFILSLIDFLSAVP